MSRLKEIFSRKPFVGIILLLLVVAVLFKAGWYLLYYEVNKNAVTPRQANEMLQTGAAVLVDVRRPDEYRAGHVKGARLIPLGELSDRLSELQPYRDKPMIVICRTGGRSAIASRKLMSAGFTGVHNLDGGIYAWQDAGLPIER